jgi:FkbH-like protein
LSGEDAQRSDYYAAERQRRRAEASCTTPEDFLRSLEQQVEIAALDGMTLTRVAQLTQKTNQFNLTTRRYSEQQIVELSRRPGWRVYSLRVRDRFGDNGIVGVAIMLCAGAAAEIDTFLLSCRVIGRGVETSLLSFLCEQARKSGCGILRGSFLPTKKNAPAREFFPSHGSDKISADAGGSVWELNLAQGSGVAPPPYIRIQAPVEATA